MSILLYAVTDAPDEFREIHGIAGQPLRRLTHGRLHAIVSDLTHELSTDESNLWAYEHIIEQLMSVDSLLPARFGTIAVTEQEVIEMLVTRQAELSQTLERVRGSVEFAVRNGAPENLNEIVTGDGAPGRAYMERLRRRAEYQRTLAERVQGAAGDLVRASRPRNETALAYLVPRARASDFADRVTGLGLAISGPWPPYSFV